MLKFSGSLWTTSPSWYQNSFRNHDQTTLLLRFDFDFEIFYLVMSTNTYVWHFYNHLHVENNSMAKKDRTWNRYCLCKVLSRNLFLKLLYHIKKKKYHWMWGKNTQQLHDDVMWMRWEEKKKEISGEERIWKHQETTKDFLFTESFCGKHVLLHCKSKRNISAVILFRF